MTIVAALDGDAIVWLGAEACHDERRTGGKAANLSRLAAAFRVPPGFCVTAGAFRRAQAFVSASTTGRPASDSARAAPAGGAPTAPPLPVALREQICSAYGALCERCGEANAAVAVRSSALDEDGSGASFAGQHETYLNVSGADAVADAVGRCWQSLYAPRALAYRQHQNVPLAGAALAVLVQQIVPATAAGVVFSANPIDNSRQEAVLTASWGLGESVVAGTVSPDTYIVRKATLEILTRIIGNKRRMTVPVPGGTEEVDVPEDEQDIPAITDGQVQDAVRLAIALEETMGWPADVECAWSGQTLYLLQCRPITTLR